MDQNEKIGNNEVKEIRPITNKRSVIKILTNSLENDLSKGKMLSRNKKNFRSEIETKIQR